MTNLEIERKFLIALPSDSLLSSHSECTKRHITQTYLKKYDNETERRVRKTVLSDNRVVYHYTEKRTVSATKNATARFEDEREITAEEYSRLLTEGVSSLTKTRYAFPYAEHIIEIDVYPHEIGGDALKGYAVMEIEMKDENEKIEIPPDITVIRELTGTREFSNKALAKPL